MKRHFQPWAETTHERNLSTFNISLYLLLSLTLPNLKNAITSIKAYPPAIIYPRVVRQAAIEKVSHSFNNGAERNKDTEKTEETDTKNNSRSDKF